MCGFNVIMEPTARFICIQIAIITMPFDRLHGCEPDIYRRRVGDKRLKTCLNSAPKTHFSPETWIPFLSRKHRVGQRSHSQLG